MLAVYFCYMYTYSLHTAWSGLDFSNRKLCSQTSKSCEHNSRSIATQQILKLTLEYWNKELNTSRCRVGYTRRRNVFVRARSNWRFSFVTERKLNILNARRWFYTIFLLAHDLSVCAQLWDIGVSTKLEKSQIYTILFGFGFVSVYF